MNNKHFIEDSNVCQTTTLIFFTVLDQKDILAGDIVTVTVTLKRTNLMDDDVVSALNNFSRNLDALN